MNIKDSAKSRALIILSCAAMNGAARAADVVPMKFINGLPFVDVVIGATSSSLMIDSGGSLGISIPEMTAEKSGSVTLLDKTTKFRDLKGQTYEVRNLVAKHVVVGNTNLDSVQGRIHVQWGGAPEGPDAELTKARQAGALGLGAFGDRPVMFDYRLGNLTIYTPGEGPRAGEQGWQALQLDYGKEGPSVSLNVNGKPLKFVLDTGTPINLVNGDSLIAVGAKYLCPTNASASDCDPRDLGEVRDESGHTVGNFSAERVKLNGAPFDGLLGAPFFRSYRVLFNFPAHLLLVSPFEVNSAKL